MKECLRISFENTFIKYLSFYIQILKLWNLNFVIQRMMAFNAFFVSFMSNTFLKLEIKIDLFVFKTYVNYWLHFDLDNYGTVFVC